MPHKIAKSLVLLTCLPFLLIGDALVIAIMWPTAGLMWAFYWAWGSVWEKVVSEWFSVRPSRLLVVLWLRRLREVWW